VTSTLRDKYNKAAFIYVAFVILGLDTSYKLASARFLSTTHSEKSLLSWLRIKPEHNVIFKVKGENGKLIEKAAYMIEVHEVLFKSGTKFVVDSVNKIDHPLNFTKRVFEITLKEI
jgi:hypothetical protein